VALDEGVTGRPPPWAPPPRPPTPWSREIPCPLGAASHRQSVTRPAMVSDAEQSINETTRRARSCGRSTAAGGGAALDLEWRDAAAVARGAGVEPAAMWR
jgi:hypothetical protein